MPLRLHVFEPRYQALLADCLRRADRFGVVAIRSGPEVGGGAECEAVGTEAVITEVQPLSGGRSRVSVTGGRRFQILERLPEAPYPRAEVSFLDDLEPAPAAFVLVGEARLALDQYANRLTRMLRRSSLSGSLPTDPLLLSWVIGSALMVELGHKQRLLEEQSVSGRLRREISLLRREVALLDLKLANQVQLAPSFDPN